jgi:hypothetical protein
MISFDEKTMLISNIFKVIMLFLLALLIGFVFTMSNKEAEIGSNNSIAEESSVYIEGIEEMLEKEIADENITEQILEEETLEEHIVTFIED